MEDKKFSIVEEDGSFKAEVKIALALDDYKLPDRTHIHLHPTAKGPVV